MGQEERLVRSIAVQRANGEFGEVEEHQLFTDVTTIRDRQQRWLAGPKRWQLSSGGGVVPIDERSFRVIGSNEVLRVASPSEHLSA